MNRNRRQSKYFKWGMTGTLMLVAAISFFFILYRFEELTEVISTLGDIMMPFVYGLVMAYLVCPLYNVCVRGFSKIKWPKIRGKDQSVGIAKGIATLISIAMIFLVIGALLYLIIPQLIESVTVIAKEMPDYVRNVVRFLQDSANHLPDAFKVQAEALISEAGGSFTDWVQSTLLPRYDSILATVSESILGILGAILDFFIGVIVCAFFINRKEIFLAQAKKLILALFKEEHADGILRGAAFTNKTFWGFISGKLIDSLVIGIICFIVMTILHWPYAVLISVIIGVTNIIPFFGPFIGAIPSAILMFMVSPKLCLAFIVFVFILQQVDGNIIGPKILGETTGLSSIWVMFAIIVGSGLFGLLGMVLGVPVFAVLYAYICYSINKRLEKKGLPTDLRDYKTLYRYADIRNPDAEYDASLAEQPEGLLHHVHHGSKASADADNEANTTEPIQEDDDRA